MGFTELETEVAVRLGLAKAGYVSPASTSLKALITQGWRATYAEMFGQSFVDSLDSIETDDKHHSEAIEWHWLARLGLIQYELEIAKSRTALADGKIAIETFKVLENKLQEALYPVFWAYLAVWARGNLKTTIVRRVTIIDALLSVAYGVGGYALIVGGTKKKVRGTATSIDTLLQSDKVKEYAPLLAKVKKGEQGGSKGWTAEFINTEANYVFHFIGLDEGIAGANVDDIRPTFIAPDDIDDREDSPVISENRFNVLTRAIIPAKQWNTLFFFAQNLISRYAVLYRIVKQHVRVLANRFITQPIPAVRGLVTEQRTVNGHIRDIVLAGKCTWRGWNLREVQNQIDAMTLPVFLMECQHDVEQSKEGLILYNYDDLVHPISYSQFAAMYGSRDAWKGWYKILFNDYARTKTKYHANVAGYMAVSSQQTDLPGHTFLIPYSFKANTAPEDMAERFLSALQSWAYKDNRSETTWKDLINQAWKRLNPERHFESVAERLDYLKSFYSQLIPKYSRPVLDGFNVRMGVISHSEDKLKQGLNIGFGFNFVPANPGKNDSIEDINDAFKVDYNEDDPFRPMEKGYTRFHVLCADDTSQEYTIVKGRKVYPPVPYRDELQPDDLHDELLFRYQMLNCRNRDPKLTELGEIIDDPLKLNDDFKQGLQMVYFKKLLSNIALTPGQVLSHIYEASTVYARDLKDDTSISAQISRSMATVKAIKEMKDEGYDIGYDGIESEPVFLPEMTEGW